MMLMGHSSGLVSAACAMALISSFNGGGDIARAEVIGYTTNALTPHNTELDTMLQASADLIADGHPWCPSLR